MRHATRPAAALALLAVALAGAARAEGAGVEVTLEPPAITVGDPTTATLALEVAGGGMPSFPDWSRGWGDAQVLEAGAVESAPAGARVRYVQRLKLTAFRTGKIALPPVAVRLGSAAGELSTPAELALEVRSVLPAEAQQATPMPPEPPRPLPTPTAAYWTIGLLTAAVVAAALLARRFGATAAGTAAGAPALPPYAELEAALAALAGAAPASGHALLSAAMRRYLGRALDFHAVESTTREIERQLAARRLEATFVARSARLLRETDQVKFARREATAEELERRRAETLGLAGALESQLHPPAPVQEGAA